MPPTTPTAAAALLAQVRQIEREREQQREGHTQERKEATQTTKPAPLSHHNSPLLFQGATFSKPARWPGAPTPVRRVWLGTGEDGRPALVWVGRRGTREVGVAGLTAEAGPSVREGAAPC